MKNKIELDYIKIKKLIKIDQDTAMKNFDSSALKRSIIKHIEEGASKKGSWFTPFNLRILVPVTMMLFLLITGLISYNYLADYSFKKDFNKIEKVFSSVPGLNHNEIKPDNLSKLDTGQEFLTRLSWVIKRGIYSSRNKQYSKVQLEKIFLKGLAANLTNNSTPAGYIKKINPDDLHIEDRVRKLMKDEKLNQFFMNLKSKKKGA